MIARFVSLAVRVHPLGVTIHSERPHPFSNGSIAMWLMLLARRRGPSGRHPGPRRDSSVGPDRDLPWSAPVPALARFPVGAEIGHHVTSH